MNIVQVVNGWKPNNGCFSCIVILSFSKKNSYFAKLEKLHQTNTYPINNVCYLLTSFKNCIFIFIEFFKLKPYQTNKKNT